MDGAKYTVRQHYAGLVKRGRSEFLRLLEGPELPLELAYLWEWSLEIRSAPRTGINGFEPLTWVDIQAWAEMTKRDDVQPFEVHALIFLDRILRNPPDEEE